MNDHYAENMRRLVDAVLTNAGETDPTLRYTVEAFAAGIARCPDEQAGKLPAKLVIYLTKYEISQPRSVKRCHAERSISVPVMKFHNQDR